MSHDFDYCIAGGGVIGLAIARELSRFGSVLLLERHALFGSETSSRNSEVIHAGLYYPSGSHKETLCLQGKTALYRFCEQYDVPHRAVGKLIVASSADAPELDKLLHKGQQLGIPLQRLNRAELQEREPLVRGEAAIWSPGTGIIDSHTYMLRLQHQAEQQGALLLRHSTLNRADPTDNGWTVQIHTADGAVSIRCAALINAAGLQAQTLAQQLHLPPGQIPPLYLCRGHYFSYQARAPFRHLIYPMPEPNMTGLGIHATLDLNGQVRFGPDTEYLSDQHPDYRIDPALADGFAQAIRRYFPTLDASVLQPDYAGIRPKLHLKHQTTSDFDIRYCHAPAPAVHLFGIESPGLTASLAIGSFVTRLLTDTAAHSHSVE